METRIYVTTLTEHRIDKQLAVYLRDALTFIHAPLVGNIKDANIIFMLNGVLNSNGQKRIDNYVKEGKKVYYFYDDLDLEIPKNVTLVTQFYNLITKNTLYFPIAELIVFDYRWDNPLVSKKIIDYLHGGTYKERRDYTSLYTYHNLLLIGDDKRWNNFSSLRMNTIRDMDAYYNIQALCRYNIILPDKKYDGNCKTLRFYEGVLTNTDVIYNGIKYSVKQIKQLTNEKKVGAELWNIVQQM